MVVSDSKCLLPSNKAEHKFPASPSIPDVNMREICLLMLAHRILKCVVDSLEIKTVLGSSETYEIKIESESIDSSSLYLLKSESKLSADTRALKVYPGSSIESYLQCNMALWLVFVPFNLFTMILYPSMFTVSYSVDITIASIVHSVPLYEFRSFFFSKKTYDDKKAIIIKIAVMVTHKILYVRDFLINRIITVTVATVAVIIMEMIFTFCGTKNPTTDAKRNSMQAENSGRLENA